MDNQCIDDNDSAEHHRPPPTVYDPRQQGPAWFITHTLTKDALPSSQIAETKPVDSAPKFSWQLPSENADTTGTLIPIKLELIDHHEVPTSIFCNVSYNDPELFDLCHPEDHLLTNPLKQERTHFKLESFPCKNEMLCAPLVDDSEVRPLQNILTSASNSTSTSEIKPPIPLCPTESSNLLHPGYTHSPVYSPGSSQGDLDTSDPLHPTCEPSSCKLELTLAINPDSPHKDPLHFPVHLPGSSQCDLDTSDPLHPTCEPSSCKLKLPLAINPDSHSPAHSPSNSEILQAPSKADPDFYLPQITSNTTHKTPCGDLPMPYSIKTELCSTVQPSSMYTTKSLSDTLNALLDAAQPQLSHLSINPCCVRLERLPIPPHRLEHRAASSVTHCMTKTHNSLLRGRVWLTAESDNSSKLSPAGNSQPRSTQSAEHKSIEQTLPDMFF